VRDVLWTQCTLKIFGESQTMSRWGIIHVYQVRYLPADLVKRFTAETWDSLFNRREKFPWLTPDWIKIRKHLLPEGAMHRLTQHPKEEAKGKDSTSITHRQKLRRNNNAYRTTLSSAVPVHKVMVYNLFESYRTLPTRMALISWAQHHGLGGDNEDLLELSAKSVDELADFQAHFLHTILFETTSISHRVGSVFNSSLLQTFAVILSILANVSAGLDLIMRNDQRHGAILLAVVPIGCLLQLIVSLIMRPDLPIKGKRQHVYDTFGLRNLVSHHTTDERFSKGETDEFVLELTELFVGPAAFLPFLAQSVVFFRVNHSEAALYTAMVFALVTAAFKSAGFERGIDRSAHFIGLEHHFHGMLPVRKHSSERLVHMLLSMILNISANIGKVGSFLLLGSARWWLPLVWFAAEFLLFSVLRRSEGSWCFCARTVHPRWSLLFNLFFFWTSNFSPVLCFRTPFFLGPHFWATTVAWGWVSSFAMTAVALTSPGFVPDRAPPLKPAFLIAGLVAAACCFLVAMMVKIRMIAPEHRWTFYRRVNVRAYIRDDLWNEVFKNEDRARIIMRYQKAYLPLVCIREWMHDNWRYFLDVDPAWLTPAFLELLKEKDIWEPPKDIASVMKMPTLKFNSNGGVSRTPTHKSTLKFNSNGGVSRTPTHKFKGGGGVSRTPTPKFKGGGGVSRTPTHKFANCGGVSQQPTVMFAPGGGGVSRQPTGQFRLEAAKNTRPEEPSQKTRAVNNWIDPASALIDEPATPTALRPSC